MGCQVEMKRRWWWVMTAMTVLIMYGVFGVMHTYGLFFGELQTEFNSTTVTTGCEEKMKNRWWWVMTAMTLVILYGVFGVMYSYGVFFGELHKEFNSTTVTTGWVQSIALCFSQVMSIPAQLLIPRVGFFKVIVSGTFMCATGLLLSSFVPSITYFYLTYGFCFGIASGIATKPTLHLVLEWVPIQYRMRATAICSCGSSFGLLTLSPVLGLIIVRVGWRWTYRVCAGLIFTVCLIIAPLLRITPDTNPENATKQQEIALDNKEHETNSNVSQRDVLRFPEMWIYAITLLIQSCAVGFTMINLIDFVTKSAGLTLEQGTLVLGVNGGAELFAKLFLSMFLDKLSFPKILLWPFTSIVAAVICILITYVTSFEVMLVLSIVLGVTKGVYNGSAYGVAADLFGPQYSASTASIVASPCGIGYLLAALVGGFSYDLTGSYDYALYACCGMYLVVGALSLFTQIWQKMWAVERYKRMRRTSKVVNIILRKGSYNAVRQNSASV